MSSNITETTPVNLYSIDLPAQTKNPIDWELLFCTKVLGLQSLHWGMWQSDDTFTLNGLRRAQQRYSDMVLSHIPEEVQSVLDVGCGVGDLSMALADQGKSVDAIAPVANYEEHINSNGRKDLTFHKSRLEDFYPGKVYDLVMMIESCGHFPKDGGLFRASELVRDDGWLLVVNPFRIRDIDAAIARHVLGTFLKDAESFGFELQEEKDITESVVPTLEYIQRIHLEHVKPGFEFGKYLMERSRIARVVMRVVGIIYRRHIATVRKRLRRYADELNPDLFREHGRYVLLLFRKTG